MKDKAHHIFHRIDILGNYTDVNWFLDLNLYQLKTLYKEAEDIWNYRAQHLTAEIKRKHIPNNDAFKLKPYKINAMTNKLQIQNIILDEFNNEDSQINPYYPRFKSHQFNIQEENN